MFSEVYPGKSENGKRKQYFQHFLHKLFETKYKIKTKQKCFHKSIDP